MKTIKVTTPEMFNDVLDLRKRVFVDEQGVDINIEQDELDTLDNPLVDHFALVINETMVIGTARCIYINDKSVRLGRFSIHPNLRHQGFGIKFLTFVENYYYRLKIETIIIHAQQQAIPFYRSAGYQPLGAEHVVAGIIHQTMKKTLYEHFYTRFAEVYDLIFPLTEQKQKVLYDFAQNKQTILDIGCATGEAMKYLNSLNVKTQGFDFDQQMVYEAQQKNLDAFHLDMRQLNGLSETYDGILCTGNVIVHLSSEDEIDSFLNDCYNRLNDEGELLIQIINYHKILNQKITELPTIQSQNKLVKFKRRYVLGNLIKFITTLKIGRKEFTSTLPLYPLLPTELIRLAEKNNFEVISTYGAFDFRAYDNNESDSFIVRFKKGEAI